MTDILGQQSTAGNLGILEKRVAQKIGRQSNLRAVQHFPDFSQFSLSPLVRHEMDK